MFVTKLSYITFGKRSTCANRLFQKKQGWILGILLNHIEKLFALYQNDGKRTHKPLEWNSETYLYSSSKFAGDKCPAACCPAGDSQATATFLSIVSFYKLLVRVRIHLSWCKCLVSSIPWMRVITLATWRRWATLQDTMTSTPIL